MTSALLDDQAITVGPYSYALPGVRLALWCGGAITLVAGFVAWRSIRRAERAAMAAGGDAAAMVERIEHGPEDRIVPPGLVEPAAAAEPAGEPTQEDGA